MQVNTGVSTKKNVADAVQEVTTGIRNPRLLVLLSAYEALEEASRLVKEKYGEVPLIGTSSTTYFKSESSDSRMILIGFGQDVEAEIGVIRNLSSAPMTDIPEMQGKVRKLVPGNSDTVCLEFCTNDEERLVTSMNVALDRYGVTLAGGTVFGIPEGAVSYVMADGVLYSDACAYAVIKNKSGRVRVYSELIFEPLDGADTHIATSVNLANKEILTLDGRPAADVYCADAGVSADKIAANVLTNPLGRVIGKDIYIASPYALGRNNSLINYKKINENDTISVMQLRDYDAVGKSTRQQMKDDSRKISFVFSINCIYRHLLYSDRGYLTTFLSGMSELGPHVGIVGGGEQCGRQHVNQTMVAVVFE